MKKRRSVPGLISRIFLILFFVLGFAFIGYRMISILQHPDGTKTTGEAAEAEQKEELLSEEVTEEAAVPAEIEPTVPADEFLVNITKDDTQVCSVIAVGDNLYHQAVINSALTRPGDPDYREIYEFVKDEVQAADLAICDQETVLTDDIYKGSGYPRFATPFQAADAIVDTGFDVIYSSTNHADDYGKESLLYTINYWKDNYPDITLVGVHDSPEDADEIKIREVNGIRIAFLNYCYGTNSDGFSGDNAYLSDLFGVGCARVSEMIQKAKSQADCVVFIAHWGAENVAMPSEYEKQWSAFLMRQGVDVCVGGHPHVLQPYGWLSDDDGHRMLVFYSLGNFVSNMDHTPQLLEGMGYFTIRKTEEPDGSSSVEITDPDVRPMIMHYDPTRTKFHVYFLDDYTDELLAQHGHRYVDGDFTLDNLQKEFDEVMAIDVEPSTDTDLLNVKQHWDGSLEKLAEDAATQKILSDKYQCYYEKGIDSEQTRR